MTEQERGRSGTGAVAVILSYLRPQNILRIVEQLDLSSQVARIVVSNNNPDIDLAPLLAAGPKLTLIQQPRRFGPSKRFEIAVQDPADFFICIDDDLFLSHLQIDQLLHALVRDPRIPHGIWGERFDWSPGGLRLRRGIHGIDAPVDIVNRCYGFTKQHATRFFRLAGLLGRPPESVELGPGDDILLSFTGNALPRCHDLGAFEDCPTSNDPSIAVWRKPDFYPRRGRLLQQLLRLPPDCTEWWVQRMSSMHRIP